MTAAIETRPAPTSDRAITEDLMARLQRHYIKPGQRPAGGVFLPEVGRNGAWGASARADALYVGFTSTSGRLLVGHEVKASRSDWLTELNKPGKADAWADQCHEWWLVTAPGVVKDGELPAGWGHMLPGRSRTRMQVVVPAERRTLTPSWDAVRSVIARMDTLAEAARQAIHAEANRTARINYDADVSRAVEARLASTPDAQTMRDRLAAIELALGSPIDTSVHSTGRPKYGPWTLTELADLAQLLTTNRELAAAHATLVSRYDQNVVEQIRDMADDLTRAIEAARTRPTEATP